MQGLSCHDVALDDTFNLMKWNGKKDLPDPPGMNSLYRRPRNRASEEFCVDNKCLKFSTITYLTH